MMVMRSGVLWKVNKRDQTKWREGREGEKEKEKEKEEEEEKERKRGGRERGDCKIRRISYCLGLDQ